LTAISATTTKAITPAPILSSSFIRIRLYPPKERQISCPGTVPPRIPVYLSAEADDVNGPKSHAWP
jgi:hypothetical protein